MPTVEEAVADLTGHVIFSFTTSYILTMCDPYHQLLFPYFPTLFCDVIFKTAVADLTGHVINSFASYSQICVYRDAGQAKEIKEMVLRAKEIFPHAVLDMCVTGSAALD